MRRRWRQLAAVVLLCILAGVVYVRTHPLVFMPTHQHCIKAAAMGLYDYAQAHGGAYPTHERGYGDALLLADHLYFYAFTGPGYDDSAFVEAARTGGNVDESRCGRVYVQGLTQKSNSEIAILFDKMPTPGGDHCPLPLRMWRPLAREVLTGYGGHRVITVEEWPVFAAEQIELLVKEGFSREEAERLYAETLP